MKHQLLPSLFIALLYGMATTSIHAIQKTVLVTGSTDGIGLTTAKHMAKKGYTVLLHGRNQQRIDQAEKEVRKFASSSSVVALPPCDLSTAAGSRQLVRCTCDALGGQPLHVLMNNAGVYSDSKVVTDDGLELTFAVNVLAPFIVSSLLLPHIQDRIVIASSLSQCRSIRDWDDVAFCDNRSYSAHTAYSESKLLDAMLCMEMADRLHDVTITCNCLDPGTVNTKMLLAGWGPIGISVRDALDQTWLCTDPEVEGVSGKYYVHQTAQRASSAAYDTSEREKMWRLLSQLAPDASDMWNDP